MKIIIKEKEEIIMLKNRFADFKQNEFLNYIKPIKKISI
tara:strand:- start:1108 stop:1224 length:117 start_codon:yes stop_codon:yes gene_type:complete